MTASSTISNSQKTNTSRSLELLDIVLLELCFGQLLEDNPRRKEWLPTEDEMSNYAFDVAAARQWNVKVNEEAGPDFDEAIKWCFEGHRNSPPESWRKEMFQHVIHPLENCHKYLSEGRKAR
ncbi:hypothetical protein F4804DRAFT_334573 [Jackrogersella minutella]|nr:hypothetical protein F4804DRAFT_334573 [Jackrogersella minutella]